MGEDSGGESGGLLRRAPKLGSEQKAEVGQEGGAVGHNDLGADWAVCIGTFEMETGGETGVGWGLGPGWVRGYRRPLLGKDKTGVREANFCAACSV